MDPQYGGLILHTIYCKMYSPQGTYADSYEHPQQCCFLRNQHNYSIHLNYYSRMADEKNAQGFLRLLDSYNRWRSARETTFQHFVSEYPEISKSPDVKTLQLKHPTRKL